MAAKLVRERQRYDHSLMSATKVIEGIQHVDSASPDSLSDWFPDVFIVVDWEPESTVINTMISSGDIALVNDRALQSALTRFRERVQAVSGRRILAEEVFMDGYRALMQSADMLRWAPGVFDASPTEQEWPWEDLADDITFRNAIYGMALGVRNHRLALNRLEVDIETLREALPQTAQGR